LYPLLPALALVLALGAGVVMVWFNPGIASIFSGLLMLAFIYFWLTPRQRENALHDALLGSEAPQRG
jgi:ethanolamine permease